MSNTDSSAIVRLIQIVQQEPIMETMRPAIDTVPTELIAPDEIEEVQPRRSGWRRFALTGVIMVGLGVGAAFYLADRGGSATASARGGLPGMEPHRQAPQASALVVPSEKSEAAPAVEAIAAPAAVEAAPAVAVATPVEPAVATPAEAAPAVVAPAVEPIAPAVAPIEPAVAPAPAAIEAPAAPAVDSPADKAVTEKAPAKAVKKSRKSRHHKSAKRSHRSRAKHRTAAVAPSGATGTLLVGSKPPCKIYIDGHYTGMKTPQRAIKLSEGKHKLELRNSEHGIKSRATVVIKAGKSTKVIKDLSDRL